MRPHPAFVVSSENIFGPGRVVASPTKGTATIEYFDSPALMEQPRCEVSITSLSRFQLEEQTRVYFQDPSSHQWSVGRVLGVVDDKVLVRLPNKVERWLPIELVNIRWQTAIGDPTEHLALRLNETPYWHRARAAFLRSLIEQRAASAGIRGLLSSVIELELHQVSVVRRVLRDPIQRYLLADEVGLGKTIEAGILIRQFVLDHRNDHSILVLVPDALVSQWRDELSAKFLLDPWLNESIHIVAHDDLDKIRRYGVSAELVVIDEAHHLSAWAASPRSRERQIFDAVKQIAGQAERKLLLLSATPVLHNERSFLALLHLLDPIVYPLDSLEAFRDRIAKRQDIAEILFALTETESNFFLKDPIDRLAAAFPHDDRLIGLTRSLGGLIDSDVDEGSPERSALIRAIRAHVSETYRLHRRILRNRRNAVPRSLTPGRGGLTELHWPSESLSDSEELLEQWRLSAANSFYGREGTAAAHDYVQLAMVFTEALMADHLALSEMLDVRLGTAASQLVERLGLTAHEQRLIESTSTFAGEDELLRRLHDSLWDVDDLPRLRRLEQTITQLLQSDQQDESRRTIVVVFASYPITADRVFNHLRSRFGPRVVRHESVDVTAEHSPEWTSFRNNRAVNVIVCDRYAEEGLNLQSPRAAMIHFDLPFSPNRIEQRIGRLDRYGGGEPIHSMVLVGDKSRVQNAWVNCLDQSLGVFARSVASLQHIIDEEMMLLQSEFWTGGFEAIENLAQRLGGPSGAVECEFRRIRAQDELDSFEIDEEEDRAFYERLLEMDQDAEKHRRATENWWLSRLLFRRFGDRSPQDSVARYWYSKPDDSGARANSQNNTATLVPLSEFADRFQEAFDFDRRSQRTLCLPSFSMSFDRRIARDRSVRIARLGEPYVDAHERYVYWDDRGICFAMWRYLPDLEITEPCELALRFDFLAEANLSECSELLKQFPQATVHAIQRLGDEFFPPIQRTVWLDSDLNRITDEARLVMLERPYSKELHESLSSGRDINLNADHWPSLNTIYPPDVWQTLCRRARIVAEDVFRDEIGFHEITQFRIERLRKRASVKSGQLESRLQHLAGIAADALRKEIDFEQRLAEAIEAGLAAPTIHLDSLGAIVLARNNPFVNTLTSDADDSVERGSTT